VPWCSWRRLSLRRIPSRLRCSCLALQGRWRRAPAPNIPLPGPGARKPRPRCAQFGRDQDRPSRYRPTPCSTCAAPGSSDRCAVQHAAQPGQRRVRMRAAHGLVQGRDLVAEVVAALVEAARVRRQHMVNKGRVDGVDTSASAAARSCSSRFRQRRASPSARHITMAIATSSSRICASALACTRAIRTSMSWSPSGLSTYILSR
jgi:hypothetical protein